MLDLATTWPDTEDWSPDNLSKVIENYYRSNYFVTEIIINVRHRDKLVAVPLAKLELIVYNQNTKRAKTGFE